MASPFWTTYKEVVEILQEFWQAFGELETGITDHLSDSELEPRAITACSLASEFATALESFTVVLQKEPKKP